ncbi:MAG TPA: winged helix-turn-helix domain-containing protein [Pyrinomonadaceae bacterium]|nr:winged helix-turn-helix domain-containing protein [Pyrinomonadaceae bacterium]
MSNKINHLYEFEDFLLDSENPCLRRRADGKLVSIPPKMLGVLILLVEKKGEIVSREELMEKVWKETFVEDGNINFTISQLRKTLGNKELIQTVPRRGYRFAADVRQIDGSDDAVVDARQSIVEPQSGIAPQAIIDPAKNRRRPMYFAAALVGVLLLSVLFAFSWRSDAGNGSRIIEPNSEALQAYRRGKMILDDKDVENRESKALEEFQRAVTADPTSALAYTGLAEGYMSKAVAMTDNQSREFYGKARIALDKAFSLDADLFEAHLARGWLRRNADWDWSGAEQDFRRAIEINPDSALAHYRYSQLLANIGRYPEALIEIRKADEIDPLSEIIINGHFPLLESAGEYEKALKLAEEYLQSNSENPFARRALATFQYHMGDYAKVIENGEIALSKGGKRQSFAWLSLLAAAHQKTGRAEKADELLGQLEIQSHTDKKALYSLAMNYAELGRAEEAVTALEKCYEAHEMRMMWVGVEPRFANLKNDPRFRRILAKMRLN